MALESIQSNVPSGLRNSKQLLQDSISGQKTNVQPPRLVQGLSGVSTLIFEAKDNIAIRYMQNCGNMPVKYAINTEVAAESFHGILAGGTVADDGLASVIDLSRFKGSIYAMSTGGDLRIATVEATAPEAAI